MKAALNFREDVLY